ncbi:MAG: DUF4258 domain-containing protein [Saprospiraceae bacterium]|nr:DUF4258 domain-containing protein [Saprospiraceae bacterium]
MEISISLHATDQLAFRKISEEEVLAVVENPDQIVEEDGLQVYQSILKSGEKNYLLRVFVNTNKVPPVVITVYKTSKINKYWQ